MAKKTRIEIEGFESLRAKIDALPKELSGRQLEHAVNAGAEVLREAAARRAPRGATGKLSDEMVKETLEKKKGRVVVGVGPSKAAFYGLFHELGTEKMSARPFLRPAFDENTAAMIQATLKELEERVKKVARRGRR